MQAQAGHSEPVVFEATAKRCPCCSVFSMGWPVAIEEGFSTEQWPESWRWAFRMDLRGFVCADCNRNLGSDRVRDKIIRDIDSKTALAPRALYHQQPLFRQEAAAV
jgi:hypothetical protein